ncbi:MAG TPA: HAMP domain-containing sensor histidine kinase [Mycobacteriales bacterium]|nr:HAMP domain-containing sensor histidine kinase [Mycobacteriales bacterium]
MDISANLTGASRRRRLPRSLDPMALPLFWKLLLPFLALMVVLGTAGTFFIMRDLSARAQTRLDQDLSRRLVEARTALNSRELYLLESANFGANIQGMDAAVRARDTAAVTRLLESVAALKGDLGLLAVTDAAGKPLVAFRRSAPGGSLASDLTSPELSTPEFSSLVAKVVRDDSGRKAAAFLTLAGSSVLAIASPVCSAAATCDASGIAVVAIDLDVVARAAALTVGSSDSAGVTVYDADGERLAAEGLSPAGGPPKRAQSELVRMGAEIAGKEAATVYAPLTIQGERRGTIAVTLPAEASFAAVRDAAYRLAFIVLLAMIGVVALGALLSRYILSQVRPLLATSRALGQGDLAARADVVTQDELGELAQGLNQMADELQASHATLESRVEQRTAEVQRLMQERSNFFAMLSHELRTPLAIIINQADLLEDGVNSANSSATQDAAQSIRRSGMQLLTLVNDILEVARAEAGRLEMTIEPVDPRAILNDLRSTLRGLAAARDISLTVRTPRSLPPVAADPRRLREVILNIVDNAVKYTPAGGTVTVDATVSTDGVMVDITVADTGVGIPDDIGDQIFEPFYRVKSTKTQHGEPSSGLGLALSHRLMTALGGSLRYESTKDGTTFIMSVPITSEAAPRPRPRPSTRVRTSAGV